MGTRELAYLGAASLLALLIAVGFGARAPLLSIERDIAPDRVSRDEASRVTLRVGNDRRFGALTLVASDRCGTEEVAVPVLRVRTGAHTTVEYPVATHRRGVVPIGPLRVTRTDPLGLIRATSTHGGTGRVLVAPRVYPIAAVPVGATRSLDGVVDKVPQGTITFDRLRPYVRGDELRHVHWRTSARLGELMVREHLEESLPRLVVLLDDRAGAYRDADLFEEACDAAASVIAAAVREDLPVTLCTVAAIAIPTTAIPTTAIPTTATPTTATPITAGSVPGSGITGGAALSGAGVAMFDRLAEVQPHTDPASTETASIEPVVRRLRTPAADTLVYLTGDGDPATTAAAAIGGLHGAYPTIVIGRFGSADPVSGVPQRVHHLRVPDAARFAAAWQAIEPW